MLDQDVINSLPDEMKAAVADYEDLFATPGWARVMDWAQRSMDEAKQRVFIAQDWDSSVFWKGTWEGFLKLSRFEDETYKQFERLAHAPEEDTPEEDPLDYE